MADTQNITVLGATGSIGINTLEVIRRHRQRFRVFALTAHRQVDALFAQCLEFAPRYLVMLDADCAEQLRAKVRARGLDSEVLAGAEALAQVATAAEVHSVVAAIVGSAGLRPALAAAKSGKRLLLANKEALVMAGAIFMDAVRRSGALLLPIDSEHNAIFQVLPRHFAGDLAAVGVKRILLTASGGPFRVAPLARLEVVTPEEACAHPNWVMGRKISVDSATMMNKGLEVIEAHWLFGAHASQIQVVIHPQSVVHSLVEYLDGSVLAQLSNPDMRTPIAYALGYPDRIEAGAAPLDLFRVGALNFEAPDCARFPALGLAYEALRLGGAAPTVLNAANEVAVEAFLEGRLPFRGIPALIEHVMGELPLPAVQTLEDVLRVDDSARNAAMLWAARKRSIVPRPHPIGGNAS